MTEYSVDHVRGEGVVGRFPVLRDGGFRDDQQSYDGALGEGEWVGGAFVYQSQTGPKEPGGSFGGELTLVPGTIKEPTGPPFDVPVLPFSLSVPSFLY